MIETFASITINIFLFIRFAHTYTRSDKEAAVMRANSWLYQFYSLHSKMHFGLAYDAHAAAAARLPAYYPSAPNGAPPAISYPAAAAPETPYHPAYHMHHAAINPLSTPGGGHHGGQGSSMLQYSPQAGSLPYPLVPMNASPVAAAESAAESHMRQTSLKRVPSPLEHATEDATSPEPSPKRAAHSDHYLPPSHPSTYHHPRAASLGYAASMFGSNAFYYSNLISYS